MVSNMVWQLREEKKSFHAVLKAAEREGPQVITVHGREKAVLLSSETYQRLIQRNGSLLDFFQTSTWAEIDIDTSRSGGAGPDIEL